MSHLRSMTIHKLVPALAFVLAGCSFVIRPTPAPTIEGERLDISVGIQLAPAQAEETRSTGGLCLIGMAHSWQVATGEALRDAAGQTFQKMFRTARVLHSDEEFAGSDLVLLVSPQVSSFTVTQDLSAELELHCVLADRRGKILYDKIMPAKGESQAAAGCLLGVAGGEMAIKETSTDAFNKAFEALAQDMRRTVDFAPYVGSPDQ